MNALKIHCPVCHQKFGDCAEELLFYTSRYYGYTEKFLARLACQPGFSMVGYEANKLSPQQRKVLTGLLTKSPIRPDLA